MADDKKNIPNAGKVDDPPKPGKVEPVKADSPVQDQPTPARAEAPVTEDASKVVTPLTAEKPVEGKTAPDPTGEQPALGGKEAPKDKDIPAPSKEGAPPGKDEKQTTIPGMGDPAPAGKVVDFTAARDGATKGKPPEKAAAPDKGKQADKAKDAAKPRRGRPAKADKAAPDKAKPQPRDKMSQSKPPAGKGAPATAEAPAATEQPPAPRDATRGVKEEIVYLNLSELHPFKNHPFGVRDDAEMQGLVESVKAAGVNQPALVRPREGGGYEIIAGHRRQRASEMAGFINMPCIVRNMTDDEAILAMTDDNLRHREKILPMEKAQSLKMQVEAIKHQGARPGEDDKSVGKRSTQVVGDRNGICRDGPLLIPDSQKAKRWFTLAAERGMPEAQYALGKLLLSGDLEVNNVDEGLQWLRRAAQGGNTYAAYRLGKEYLTGEHIPKSTETAVCCFRSSAEQGNPFAQYMLGKLYLEGKAVPRDQEQAVQWFRRSAAQGNRYAHFFLDRQSDLRPPGVMLSVTRLLHHLSRIFRENSLPAAGPGIIQIDRKRLRQLREKHIALGHKPDDHPEQGWGGMTMGGM